eukprot:m.132455 g.132455  ORF g.132455 m.132455 type:complete len:491 (+) comp22448_c0_seq1:66-1538(+)
MEEGGQGVDTTNDEAIARALQAAEAEETAPQTTVGEQRVSGSGKEAGRGTRGSRSAPATPPRARKPGKGSTPTETAIDADLSEHADITGTLPKSERKTASTGPRKSKGAHKRTHSEEVSSSTPRRTDPSAADAKPRAHRRSSSSTSQDSFGDTASTTYQRMRGRYEKWRENQRAIANSIRELSPRLQKLGLRGKGPLNDLTGAYRTFFTKWEQLVKTRTVTVDEMSAAVQEAYEGVDERVWGGSAAWASIDETVATNAQAFFEQYLMDQLYELVFAAHPDDETSDLKLQEKIRLLRWVSPDHLNANFNPENPLVQKAFENAQDQLIMMDSQRAPHDKLERVVSASKGIFDVLQLAGGSPAGADDFMPLLIYTVIRANPPMLYSNLQYITRFGNQKKLNSGEAGYFYTNLYGAVEFVSKLDAEALQMSPREFHKLTQQNDLYKSVPDLKSHAALTEALERLAALGPRQEKIRSDLVQLNQLLDESIAAGTA